MKKLILVMAMVLLSTAAWGQVDMKDLERLHKDECTERFWKAMLAKGIMAVTFEEKLQWCTDNQPIKSGVSYIAPYPTAWKHTYSKYGAEEIKSLCFSRCKDGAWNHGVETANYNCYQDCMLACEKDRPWADSRYRLEKNDISNEYRVTQCNNYGTGCTWVPAGGGTTTDYNEALKILDNLRQKEAEARRLLKINDAWRPIK